LQDNTVNRLILMSSSERHMANVPMAFFIEPADDVPSAARRTPPEEAFVSTDDMQCVPSLNRYVGNLAPINGVFPDYQAPIVRTGVGGRELVTARWGMPSSSKALLDATKKRADKLRAKGKTVDFDELLRMEPDVGTTNIRNVRSKHWTRWLGPEQRCVIPFNSFSEFNKAEGGDIWFARDETRPLACFAGIWTNWTSVRKVKEGETTNHLFGFLTTDANV
jgi:putative SOS response-associated peptidase YedK